MDETKGMPEQTEWAGEIQKDLSGKGLSRRLLLDRLKVAGVGFGAAVALGVKEAAAADGKTATLASTNKVLNDIVQEGRTTHANDTGISPDMNNYIIFYRRFFYRRSYRRFIRRFYRYRRF